MAASRSVTATDLSTSNATSFTFSSASLGDEDSDRKIIVAAASGGDSGNKVYSSCTVAGNGTTIALQEQSTVGSYAAICMLAILSLTTGTTGDVVVSTTGGVQGCRIVVYRVLGIDSTTAAATASDDAHASGVLDLDINTSDGDLLIGVAIAQNASTWSWTGATEDDDTAQNNKRSTTASAIVSSGETPRTVTATNASTTPYDATGVSAVWAEASSGHTATATLTGATPTISAVGVQQPEATAALDIADAEIDATAIFGSATATALLDIVAATVDAVAVMQPDAVATLDIQSADINATMLFGALTGTAVLDIQTADIDAVMVLQPETVGTLNIADATIDAQASQPFDVQALLDIQVARIDAVGAMQPDTAAILDIAAAAIDATGEHVSTNVTGTAALDISVATISAIGLMQPSAAATLDIQDAVINAIVVRASLASGGWHIAVMPRRRGKRARR